MEMGVVKESTFDCQKGSKPLAFEKANILKERSGYFVL